MITEQEFKEAADLIGCDIPAIKAVFDTEAAGAGFLRDGRVKILFEGHRFWKQLAKAGFDPTTVSRQNISRLFLYLL